MTNRTTPKDRRVGTRAPTSAPAGALVQIGADELARLRAAARLLDEQDAAQANARPLEGYDPLLGATSAHTATAYALEHGGVPVDQFVPGEADDDDDTLETDASVARDEYDQLTDAELDRLELPAGLRPAPRGGGSTGAQRPRAPGRASGPATVRALPPATVASATTARTVAAAAADDDDADLDLPPPPIPIADALSGWLDVGEIDTTFAGHGYVFKMHLDPSLDFLAAAEKLQDAARQAKKASLRSGTQITPRVRIEHLQTLLSDLVVAWNYVYGNGLPMPQPPAGVFRLRGPILLATFNRALQELSPSKENSRT